MPVRLTPSVGTRAAAVIRKVILPDPVYTVATQVPAARTFVLSKAPGWFPIALAHLDDIRSLAENWDGEGGRAMPAEALETAALALDVALRMRAPAPFMTPMSRGGVQLEWTRNRRELELSFGAGGRVEYLRVHPDGSMAEGMYEAFDQRQIAEHLYWLVHGET